MERSKTKKMEKENPEKERETLDEVILSLQDFGNDIQFLESSLKSKQEMIDTLNRGLCRVSFFVPVPVPVSALASEIQLERVHALNLQAQLNAATHEQSTLIDLLKEQNRITSSMSDIAVLRLATSTMSI